LETKKKYPAFELISIEVQGSDSEVIKDHVDHYKMKHPVAERGSFAGNMGYGVPCSIVFDHKGKRLLINREFTRRVRETILKALEEAPHPLLGNKTYKILKEETQKIKENRDLGLVLKKVRAIWEDDAAELELWDEAQILYSRLDNYGESLLADAEIETEKSPILGLALYKKIAERFKGDRISEQANLAIQSITRDKNFPKEKKAWELWEEFLIPYKAHRFRMSRCNRRMLKILDSIILECKDTAGGKLALDMKPGLIEALNRYGDL